MSIRRDLRRLRRWLRQAWCVHVMFYVGRIPGTDRVRARCNWCGARREVRVSEIIG